MLAHPFCRLVHRGRGARGSRDAFAWECTIPLVGHATDPRCPPDSQVVGIDIAIVWQSGGAVGIGFAIPIKEAKTILPELEAKGR